MSMNNKPNQQNRPGATNTNANRANNPFQGGANTPRPGMTGSSTGPTANKGSYQQPGQQKGPQKGTDKNKW